MECSTSRKEIPWRGELRSSAPNPEPTFAGAYDACSDGALGNEAKKLGIHVENSTVRALVSLNEDQSGFRLAVELHAQLPGTNRDQAQRIMEAAHRACPYSKALRGDVPVTVVVD